MPKNNGLSKGDGLEMNSSSIGLGKNDTVSICSYHSKDNSVTYTEEAALTSDMKDKKYAERSPSDQCIKSFMPPTPGPPLIILKLVFLESEV